MTVKITDKLWRGKVNSLLQELQKLGAMETLNSLDMKAPVVVKRRWVYISGLTPREVTRLLQFVKDMT